MRVLHRIVFDARYARCGTLKSMAVKLRPCREEGSDKVAGPGGAYYRRNAAAIAIHR